MSDHGESAIGEGEEEDEDESDESKGEEEHKTKMDWKQPVIASQQTQGHHSVTPDNMSPLQSLEQSGINFGASDDSL